MTIRDYAKRFASDWLRCFDNRDWPVQGHQDTIVSMRWSGVALALLVVAPACSKRSGGGSSTAEHHTTYTSKELHFSVEAPREERTDHLQTPTLDGPVESQIVRFDDPQEPGRIEVCVTPMPFADGHRYTPERIFDFEVGKLLRRIAGRISHQENLTVDGVQGREIEATGVASARILSSLELVDDAASEDEKRDLPVSALVRMFYRKGTLYQVIAVYPTSASGTSTEAKQVVRSFEPIALPKLARGVGEVSGLTCSPNFVGDSRSYYVYVNPKFTVQLEQRLEPGDEIRIQAWCHVRDKDGEVIVGDSDELDKKDMDELTRHGKVETTATIRLWAVFHDPDVCQWSFRVRSGSEDRASLGDFCWTDAKVTTGRCGT